MNLKVSTMFISIISSLLLPAASFADTANLSQARINTIKQYLNGLGHADTQAVVSAFAPGGYVISTSKGKLPAASFFEGFLPELSSETLAISQIYQALHDKNHFDASFAFSYTLKDGTAGGGHYDDEFYFADDSDKLTYVIMYENLKF